MDKFCVVLFFIFCIHITDLAGQSESENEYLVGNIPKNELLDDISRLMERIFIDQEHRFDARMREFENTMQNLLREEFVRRMQLILEALMVSTKTSSAAAPGDVPHSTSSNSYYQQTTGPALGQNCLDWNNSVVTEGQIYQPYSNDLCVSCRCRNGLPFECNSVMCERPTCKTFTRVQGRCCEYVCQNTSSLPLNLNSTLNPASTSNPPSENVMVSQSVLEIYGPDYLEEGHRLSLTCRTTFQNTPPTFSWFQNGVERTVENAFIQTLTVMQDKRKSSTLHIEQVTLKDTGTYVCRTSENEVASKYVVILNATQATTPSFTETSLQTTSPPATCKDWKNNIVNNGEQFSPYGNDICFKCVCDNGQQTACMSVSCFRPECENYQVIEGKCCEFKCLPPPPIINEIQQDAAVGNLGVCNDGNGNTVMDGELYAPDSEDLCLKCTCESGLPINCHTEDCFPPKCQNYVRHKGICCQFTCLQDSNNHETAKDNVQEAGSCVDLNNTKINEGNTFHPYRDDPCIFCTCEDGYPTLCGSEQCNKPVCPNYTPITGTCCDYVCNTDFQPEGKDTGNELTLDEKNNPLFFCGEPGCRLEYNEFLEKNQLSHNISLSFKTISVDGIMFFTESVTNSSNYEMIWMSNGRIIFSFDLGSGGIDIASQQMYNDDQWHKVIVSRNKNKGVLYVDEEEVHGVTSGDSNFLEKSGVSYVGALPENMETTALPSKLNGT